MNYKTMLSAAIATTFIGCAVPHTVPAEVPASKARQECKVKTDMPLDNVVQEIHTSLNKGAVKVENYAGQTIIMNKIKGKQDLYLTVIDQSYSHPIAFGMRNTPGIVGHRVWMADDEAQSCYTNESFMDIDFDKDCVTFPSTKAPVKRLWEESLRATHHALTEPACTMPDSMHFRTTMEALHPKHFYKK